MTLKRFWIIVGIFTAAVAGTVAWTVVGVGTGWSQRPPNNSEPATYKDSNQRLKEVEADIPEFGGAFLSDNQSVLNIYLTENETDPTIQERARKKVEKSFGVKPGLKLNVIKGGYTITQLADWIELAKSKGLWDREGVIMLDLQEASNEIYIGVVNWENVEPVYTFLVEIGIPREAVAVEVIEQPRSMEKTIRNP